MEAKLVRVRDRWVGLKFVIGPINARRVLGLQTKETAHLLADLDESQVVLTALQSSRYHLSFAKVRVRRTATEWLHLTRPAH